jgi:hypothetical protein
MISNTQQQAVNKLSPYLDKAELFIAAFILIALVFKIQHWPGAGIMLTVLLTTLAVMYFFNAFAQITNPQLRMMDVFFNKVMYWGLSVGAQGLLFTLQKWPGGDMMVLISSVTSVVSILYVLKVKNESPEASVFSNRVLLRLIVFAVICITAVVGYY